MSLIALVMTFCFADPPLIFPVTGRYAAVDAAHVESDYYVVMFTASYCGPCRDYKSSGKPAELKAAGYPLTYIDTQKNKEFYSGRIPKFWLCKDNQKIHEWPDGTVEPSTILAKIRQLKGQKAVSTSNFFGRRGTSHESRQTPIDHFLNDGIHKGRHTRESLESLSDEDLVELHDAEHKTAGHSVKNGLWKP